MSENELEGRAQHGEANEGGSMSENELDSLMRQADMSRKDAVEESMDWSGEGKVGHTPGPWGVEWQHPCYWIIRDESGSGVHLPPGSAIDDPNRLLIERAPELDAYRQYIEDNLERIERGGWTPVCFDEFRESEECANYMKEEA